MSLCFKKCFFLVKVFWVICTGVKQSFFMICQWVYGSFPFLMHLSISTHLKKYVYKKSQCTYFKCINTWILHFCEILQKCSALTKLWNSLNRYFDVFLIFIYLGHEHMIQVSNSVPWVEGQSFNHWTMKEVPIFFWILSNSWSDWKTEKDYLTRIIQSFIF